MRCPRCGDYGLDIDDGCRNCGYKEPKARPPAWWGSSDFSKNRANKPRESEKTANTRGLNREERLERLGRLFAAANTGHYIGCTCLECARELERQQHSRRKPAQFQNPLLLTAKMFLSEVRSWRENYQYLHYVCTHFAKVLFDAATVRGIRCGFVTVSFQNKEAHAIIAFETDYGLTYFEPQTGDQEHLEVGRPYASRLEGVPSDCPVAGIDIDWNDQMELSFAKCLERNCGYVWPVKSDDRHDIVCPLDGSGNVAFTDQGRL